MKQNDRKEIPFEDIKDIIIKTLEKKDLNIKEPITIVHGVFMWNFTLNANDGFFLGGPTIPVVMFLGNKTGRLYPFALKAILPKKILKKYDYL